MEYVAMTVGAVLTLGGAGGLVAAFRHGQAGRRAAERRSFTVAVGALALGSVAFFASVALL